MVNELVKKWLKIKGWSSPNTTQAKAVEAGLLEEKRNFVVIAPTASGKTPQTHRWRVFCLERLVVLAKESLNSVFNLILARKNIYGLSS